MSANSYKLSRDGRFLLDRRGVKVKKYLRSVDGYVPLRTVSPKSAQNCTVIWDCSNKLCVLYDENMNCRQWVKDCIPTLDCPWAKD